VTWSEKKARLNDLLRRGDSTNLQKNRAKLVFRAKYLGFSRVRATISGCFECPVACCSGYRKTALHPREIDELTLTWRQRKTVPFSALPCASHFKSSPQRFELTGT
jgi:hypothetical protein